MADRGRSVDSTHGRGDRVPALETGASLVGASASSGPRRPGGAQFPDPAPLAEFLQPPPKNPLEAYWTNSPNGELRHALRDVPGLADSTLGQEIWRVLHEVSPGFAVSGNHPDLLPLLEALKFAPGVAGTEREVEIGRVQESGVSQGTPRHRGIVFPHAKDLGVLFEEARPWRDKEDDAANPDTVYLTVSGDQNGYRSFAVKPKPEVTAGIAACMETTHEFGGGYHLAASLVEPEDESEPYVRLDARYNLISGGRLLAEVDPKGLLGLSADKPAAPSPLASNGLKKNGAKVGIGADVLDVLIKSEIEGNIVKLPGQLDSKLYKKVDEVLNLLGGKWNRSNGGHLFKNDPSESFQAALEAGEVEDTVKRVQFFPTPRPVAEKLVGLAGVAASHRVLEPSAGARGIVNELTECKLEVCELNPEQATDLKAAGLAVVGTDFLEYNPGPVYDRIVANPPFTRGQDVAHANHMLDCLAPGGRLVTVIAGGFDYRTDKATKNLQARLDAECPGYQVIPLDEGAFKSSGTFVRTSVLVADKRHNA